MQEACSATTSSNRTIKCPSDKSETDRKENIMTVAIPSTVWLAVTSACNNRCSWCYAQNNDGQSSAEKENSPSLMMALEDVKLLLKTLSEVGVKRCILVGGEPTLHPSLKEIIAQIRLAGMESVLVTNGRKAQDMKYAQDLVEAGLNNVTVSMHGWSPDSYEGQNGRSQTIKAAAFKQALTGYTNFKNSDVHTGINIVLGRSTEKHTREIVQFINDLGVSQLGFNIAAPAISKSRITADYTLTIDQYREHILDVHSRCNDKGIHASFQLGLPLCIFTKSELELLKQTNSIKQGCHILYGGGIVVNPDLTPAICTHLMDYNLIDTRSARNIFSCPELFFDYWNNDDLKGLRQTANVYRIEKCQTCELWGECGGGCMIHWTFHDPVKINMRYFNSQ